jgi:peptidoglycan/LPS O-acetylase OafA/YrhL
LSAVTKADTQASEGMAGSSDRDRVAPPTSRRVWRNVWDILLSRPEQHFAALDGLRAIAALVIVLFHCSLFVGLATPETLASLPLGFVQWLFVRCWLGVDVFFVLSGFLIGRILLVQLSRGGINFRAFYIRRVFRIFPAYYVVLSLSIFVFSRMDSFRPLYWNTPWFELLHRSWSNELYVSNYILGGDPHNAMSWGWSLCIEEHFYLLLPASLTLLFQWASGWRRLAVLSVVGWLPLVGRVVTFGRDPGAGILDGPYYYSHSHSDGLLLGVLIAYGYVYHRDALSRLATSVNG